MMITSEFPTTGVATFVADVARRHGVSYVRSSNDALADFITQFSDDVVTDQTEDLIIALKRSKVIDDSQMVALLGNHMDEAKQVRPAWGLLGI